MMFPLFRSLPMAAEGEGSCLCLTSDIRLSKGRRLRVVVQRRDKPDADRTSGRFWVYGTVIDNSGRGWQAPDIAGYGDTPRQACDEAAAKAEAGERWAIAAAFSALSVAMTTPDDLYLTTIGAEEAVRIGAGCANVYLAELLRAALERARNGEPLNALDLAALDEAADRVAENASHADDSGDYYGPNGPPDDDDRTDLDDHGNNRCASHD